MSSSTHPELSHSTSLHLLPKKTPFSCLLSLSRHCPSPVMVTMACQVLLINPISQSPPTAALSPLLQRKRLCWLLKLLRGKLRCMGGEGQKWYLQELGGGGICASTTQKVSCEVSGKSSAKKQRLLSRTWAALLEIISKNKQEKPKADLSVTSCFHPCKEHTEVPCSCLS